VAQPLLYVDRTQSLSCCVSLFRPSFPSADLTDNSGGVSIHEAVAETMRTAEEEAATAGMGLLGQHELAAASSPGHLEEPHQQQHHQDQPAALSAALAGSTEAAPRRLAGIGSEARLSASAARSLSTSSTTAAAAAGGGGGAVLGSGEEEVVAQGPSCRWPGWQTRLAQKKVAKQGDPPGSCNKAVSMDGLGSPHTSFTTRGLVS
jgi:hypothetical protein